MIKTFYVQLDHENKITDIIEFPYEDYIKVNLATPLPPNILGGAYELINNQPIYRKEWDTNNFNTLLLQQQEVIDQLLLDSLGGM